MKKIFLTTVLSLMTILASAQFMVTSTLSSPADGEEVGLDNLTDNIGLLYSLDKISVGIMTNGDNYDLLARYTINDNIYVYGLMGEEDELSVGLGYSLNLTGNLYLEPSYVYDMSEDTNMCDDMGMGKTKDEKKGELKLSLTYKL
tara:strand:- start:342 stop:776 length:435 start_codon:yes stop_codon:yes gene_type:complete